MVTPGIYPESIHIENKTIHLQSLDPDDPYYIGSTILQGDGVEPGR